MDKKTYDLLLLLGGALNALDKRAKAETTEFERPSVEKQEGAREEEHVGQAEDPLTMLRQLLEGKRSSEPTQRTDNGHTSHQIPPTMTDVLSLLSLVFGEENVSQHKVAREHQTGMKMSLIAENLVRMGYMVTAGESPHIMKVHVENELLVSLFFDQDGAIRKKDEYDKEKQLNQLNLLKANARDEMKTALNMGLEDSVVVELTEKFNDCLSEINQYQESLERKRSMVNQIETLVKEIDTSF